MEIWAMSDQGLVRPENEDAYAVSTLTENQRLCVVCDGMGGAKAGRYASSLACEVFTEEVKRLVHAEMSRPEMAEMMSSACRLANTAVFEQSQMDRDFSGMGTTLVAAFFQGNEAMLANVGDSRVYHFAADGVHRLTVDHSVVEDMVRHGDLTAEEARVHPRKNLITRAVGVEKNVECDLFAQTLEPGTFYLLCTDGLYNAVSDQEMLFEILHGSNLSGCCQRLISIANGAGAPDNITMILIAV